jgi:hypothetical protein
MVLAQGHSDIPTDRGGPSFFRDPRFLGINLILNLVLEIYHLTLLAQYAADIGPLAMLLA